MLPTLLYDSEIWTLKAQDKKKNTEISRTKFLEKKM